MKVRLDYRSLRAMIETAEQVKVAVEHGLGRLFVPVQKDALLGVLKFAEDSTWLAEWDRDILLVGGE